MTSTHSVYTDIWCLGVLIIQIISETYPLGVSKSLSKDDPDAPSTRERIRRYDFLTAHPDLFAGQGSLKSIGQIVRDCHALQPNVRPSAAFVAEQLFDLLSSTVLEMDPSPGKPEAAIVAVSLALEAHLKQALESDGNKSASPQLDPDHWTSLEQAYLDGNPIASMLLGRAIWTGLWVTSSERSGVVLAPGRDADESEKAKSPLSIRLANTVATVRRARAAQKYLEFAVDAGVSGLAKDLQDIHSCLARAYRALVPPAASKQPATA